MLATAATILDLRQGLRVEIDRHPVHVTTTLDDPQAAVLNVSRHGVLVETAAPATVGSAIALTLPTIGVVDADIVWTRGTHVGCQLLEPLGMAAYAEMLMAMPRRS